MITIVKVFKIGIMLLIFDKKIQLPSASATTSTEYEYNSFGDVNRDMMHVLVP